MSIGWKVAIGFWMTGLAVVILVPTAVFGWGAAQLGPIATWVFGGVTLAALALAFSESRRAAGESLRSERRIERQRRVDHEIERRRECIKAVTDVWAAIVAQLPYVLSLIDSFEELIQRPPDDMGVALQLARQTVDETLAFQRRWTEAVEGPIGYALIVCSKSPIEENLREVNGEMRALTKAMVHIANHLSLGADAPSVQPLRDQWSKIAKLRQPSMDRMREVLTLDWDSVSGAIEAKAQVE